jgi:hypothetical protein
VPARLFEQVIFAPPRRIADPRAPRLGAFARRGSAAPLRLRTLLPRVAAPPRRIADPRLGAFARRGLAAPPRLRTLLPRVAAPPRPPRRIADPRAPRLGAFARRGSAAPPRLRTLLPQA